MADLPTMIARGIAESSPAPDRPEHSDPLFEQRAVVFASDGAHEVAVLTDRAPESSENAYLTCDTDALEDVREVR